MDLEFVEGFKPAARTLKQPVTAIVVANVGLEPSPDKSAQKVAKIEAVKEPARSAGSDGRRPVGRGYPASIGSKEKPAPEGT